MVQPTRLLKPPPRPVTQSKWIVRLDGLEQNFDVDITRRGKWGNPFIVGVHGTRAEVIAKHYEWINGRMQAPEFQSPPTHDEIRAELKGARLGCHCAPKPCHGDVLAAIANSPERKGLFSSLMKT